jgi:hypothetical protein
MSASCGSVHQHACQAEIAGRGITGAGFRASGGYVGETGRARRFVLETTSLERPALVRVSLGHAACIRPRADT